MSSVVANNGNVASVKPTPISEIASKVNSLRASFKTGITSSIEYRKEQIMQVRKLISENKDDLAAAIEADMKRHRTFSSRILGGCVGSCNVALDNIDSWSKPQVLDNVGKNKCEVRYSPKGVALIVGTWNFPNPLVWKPLVAALSAGNVVLLKLNEVCVATSTLMGKLAEKYLDPKCVQIVQGGIPVATEVLKQKFSVIFYTGNTTVGRIVMRAAAEHLTPCILELGGKNPVVVAKDADLKNAARKIVDGRLKNTGQFCVAPDYVLCDASVQPELTQYMKDAVEEFFTSDPKTCKSFGRIINQRHCSRIANVLKEDHGGEIICGGDYDLNESYIAPTIVLNPKEKSQIMEDEIFGPVMPIKTVQSVEEAINFITAKPHSLACYVFSSSQETVDKVINSTFSGGACANDVIIHMLNETLPFGGSGPSGHGSYHGIYGFKAFSHEKGVMLVDSKDDGGGRYPPFK